MNISMNADNFFGAGTVERVKARKTSKFRRATLGYTPTTACERLR